jgi:hypothetical protein
MFSGVTTASSTAPLVSASTQRGQQINKPPTNPPSVSRRPNVFRAGQRQSAMDYLVE